METGAECDKKIIKLDYSSYGDKHNFLLGSPRTGCEKFEGVAISSNRAIEILWFLLVWTCFNL